MKKILLAVDFSNNIYKSAAANPNLSSEGRFTGGLYGFIVSMYKAIQDTEATEVVICCDHKPYKRSGDYPEYKALREHKKDQQLVENVAYSKKIILELLELLGWPVWSIPGFESDDLIGFTVQKYRHRFDQIVAASNDSDLHQLFKWNNFSIYRGKKGFFTRDKFDAEWGINPSLVPQLLALSGTHNEIEGISGIGLVNAKRIVCSPADMRKVREKYANIIDRNISLITLPHPEFPEESILPKQTKRCSERQLIKFCAIYDINIPQSVSEELLKIGSDL